MHALLLLLYILQYYAFYMKLQVMYTITYARG